MAPSGYPLFDFVMISLVLQSLHLDQTIYYFTLAPAISVAMLWKMFIDLWTFKMIYEHKLIYELFMNIEIQHKFVASN